MFIRGQYNKISPLTPVRPGYGGEVLGPTFSAYLQALLPISNPTAIDSTDQFGITLQKNPKTILVRDSI